MPSNFHAIDGTVCEPEAKILDVYGKTPAELAEFQVIPQMHYDQTSETWTQVGHSRAFYLFW